MCYYRCVPTDHFVYIGHIIVIFLLQSFAWTTFIAIACSLVSTSYKAVANQHHTTKLEEAKKNLIILSTLSVLLGLPWVFIYVGFLLRNNSTVGNAILYAATTTDLLQGPLLFLLQGIRLPEVRQLWRRWLCCRKCREMRQSQTIHSHHVNLSNAEQFVITNSSRF